MDKKNKKSLKKLTKKCSKAYEKAYKKRIKLENFVKEHNINISEEHLCDLIESELVYEHKPKNFRKKLLN